MQQQLTNQVAIVTGAGRGIGAAIATRLAAAGVRVAVNDLNPDRAQRIADEINTSGGTAIAVAADVANKFQCVHLIESTRDAWGQLDILVNYAATVPNVSILKMDEWDWNRCFEVNLKGTFFMTQLCGRVMADENGERGGVIVNVCSTQGLETAVSNRSAYAANSAGIVGFTKACGVELTPHHIRTYAVMTTVENSNETYGNKVAESVLALCPRTAKYKAGTALTVNATAETFTQS